MIQKGACRSTVLDSMEPRIRVSVPCDMQDAEMQDPERYIPFHKMISETEGGDI